MYILVVDDDQFANQLVQFVLHKEGYEVAVADNPRGALEMIRRREPDLLVVDVLMPYINGFEFSRRLRADGYDTPLIFLTGQDAPEAKKQGFDIGADDYICKPYSHEELVARVKAVLRRICKQNGQIIAQSVRIGRLELIPTDLKIMVDGNPINLTQRETQILRLLMRQRDHVVSRCQIVEEVWEGEELESNNVDVYVSRLRKKIEVDKNKPQYILSVRGEGYKFVSGE